MALPLRLPYCAPARHVRAVLLFPCFRAPVTPPLSPAGSLEPDSEPEGVSAENPDDDEAWLYAACRSRRSAGAAPQGWASRGPASAPHTPQAALRPRPGPLPTAPAPGSVSALAASRNHQPIRPAQLSRRPPVAQGPRRSCRSHGRREGAESERPERAALEERGRSRAAHPRAPDLGLRRFRRPLYVPGEEKWEAEQACQRLGKKVPGNLQKSDPGIHRSRKAQMNYDRDAS